MAGIVEPVSRAAQAKGVVMGVFGTQSGWPDIAVASIMAVLGLSAARDILQRARAELRHLPTSMS